MFGSKSIRTILIIAGLTGLLTVCANAQKLYVSFWSSAAKQQILRFDTYLEAAPASGQTGAVFADLPDTASWDQGMQKMAYNPADGYLYVTNYGDSNGSTALWGDGSQFVTRYNGFTGLKDANWKVWVRGNHPVNRAGDINFAPDGRLYVGEHYFGGIHLIDIAAKTSTQVKAGKLEGFTFDPAGRAYVSVANKVERFTTSGATWTLDPSFNTGAATPAGSAYGIVFNPNDGYLYVNDYGVNIYRYDSTGARDLNWSADTGGFSRNMSIGPDGRLYVAVHYGVFSFDVTTGTLPTRQLIAGTSGQCFDATWDLTPSVSDTPVVPEPGPQAMYIDDASVNDILRYDINASGSVFANWTQTASVQYHNMAYRPQDGYLYVTSPYDRDPYRWGDGCYTVTRYNAVTGVKDVAWKAETGSEALRLGDLALSPDGRLYAVEFNLGRVYRISIPSQAAAQVLSGFIPNGIAFDSAGAAYVSEGGTNNRVRRYTVSGAVLTQDMSYDGNMGAVPGKMVYGPDGWLYVIGNNGIIRRLNSAGVVDPGWSMDVSGQSGGICFGPDGYLYATYYNGITQGGVAGVMRCKPDMSQTWEPLAGFVRIPWIWPSYEAYVMDLEWANVPGMLKGHVDLQNLDAGTSPVVMKVEFSKAGVTQWTETVTLDSAGNYTVPNVTQGLYDVTFKVSTWAPKVVSNVAVIPSGGLATTCNVSMVSGDLDGDNAVTNTDTGAVAPNLDQKGN